MGRLQVDSAKPVLVPGDPERQQTVMNRQNAGIVYHNSQVEACKRLAAEYNVKPMMFLEEV